MRTLTTQEMARVSGEGFWGGVGCGLGAVTALVLWTSPDPVSKVALLSYGGAVLSCVSAYL